MEKHNNVCITKFSNTKFITTMQLALPNGYPVIVEEVDETIDPIIDPILTKAFTISDGRMLGHICKEGN